jgi:hypothetical protein
MISDGRGAPGGERTFLRIKAALPRSRIMAKPYAQAFLGIAPRGETGRGPGFSDFTRAIRAFHPDLFELPPAV